MAKRKGSRIKDKVLNDVLLEELSGIDDAVEMGNPNPVIEEANEALAEVAEVVDINFEDNVIDMTSVKEGDEHSILTKTIKDEFNPNSTQDALADEDVEGGVYVYRSTSSGMSSSNQGGLYKGTTANIDGGQVELSGFKVVVDFGNGDQGIDVRAAFNDINTAKASINGDKFIFIDNGAMRIGTIVSGSPIISNDEREIAKFVNGEWKRP